MKKIIIFSLIFALLIPFTIACGNENKSIDTNDTAAQSETLPNVPLAGKNVVHSIGFKDLYAIGLCDRSTEEAVYEFSTQILKCKILEMTKVQYTVHGTLSFQYSAQVEKIYFDVSETLNEGDIITVSSAEGILTVEEAADIIPDTKFSSFDESKYNKDDYVVSSLYDGIPIETGVSYIIHLSYYENEDVYADCGYSYMYGIYNGLYQGADPTKCKFTLEELEEQIAEGVSKRTGRLEEIGETELMKELGKKQAEELLAELEKEEAEKEE